MISIFKYSSVYRNALDFIKEYLPICYYFSFILFCSISIIFVDIFGILRNLTYIEGKNNTSIIKHIVLFKKLQIVQIVILIIVDHDEIHWSQLFSQIFYIRAQFTHPYFTIIYHICVS